MSSNTTQRAIAALANQADPDRDLEEVAVGRDLSTVITGEVSRQSDRAIAPLCYSNFFGRTTKKARGCSTPSLSDVLDGQRETRTLTAEAATF